ncbi:MAG: hypothetical protein V5A43_02140 [Haloarculaceae archaeon]
MPVTRWAVLERLATATDAERGETVTIDTLAVGLDANRDVVEAHLTHLVDCDLARRPAEGTGRVTITGQELLELDTDGVLVVEPQPDGFER